MNAKILKAQIREVMDFPKEGISYKDITTVLKDPVAFNYVIEQMLSWYQDTDIDIVVGPEARGFIIGAPLAIGLGAGFVPVRKAGKLPAQVQRVSYELEYGTDNLEMHIDAIKPGQKVLVVDDLLATGGTIKSVVDLVSKLQGNVVGIGFMIELTDLKGKEQLAQYPVQSLIKY